MYFNTYDFAQTLKNELAKNFPRDTGEMVENALVRNPIMRFGNTCIFEVGSYHAEKNVPYYHILEDAQVISKSGRSTASSRGSQANISELGKRDYGIISKSRSNNIFQEYRKNVRGSRSKVGKAQYYEWTTNYKRYVVNRESKYYVNIHYHYIERALETKVLDRLANTFNLKRTRTKIDNTITANVMTELGDKMGGE